MYSLHMKFRNVYNLPIGFVFALGLMFLSVDVSAREIVCKPTSETIKNCGIRKTYEVTFTENLNQYGLQKMRRHCGHELGPGLQALYRPKKMELKFPMCGRKANCVGIFKCSVSELPTSPKIESSGSNINEVDAVSAAAQSSQQQAEVSTSANAQNFGFLSSNELRQMASVIEPKKHWQKSKWWLDGYFSASGKAKLKKVADKPLNLLMGPPNCPTNWTWFWGNTPTSFVQKWRDRMKERLNGFPSEVVKYCSKELMPIKGGFITNHTVNERHVHRGVATVIIRDLKSDKVVALRAIQENDYTSKKTGGKIYNANLKEVCEFKFLKGGKAIVKCKHFGSFASAFNITDLFKGKYKLFGKNDKFAFFVTNLDLKETKQKYKTLLTSKTKKTKCAFNCK